MDLNEAIKHCHEKAEEIRKANEEMPTDCKLSEDLCECASEHEQLAAWLTELLERREADDISYEGMTVSEALHDLEDCVLPVVGGKSIRIAIRALKAICDRSKPCESEAAK